MREKMLIKVLITETVILVVVRDTIEVRNLAEISFF